MTDQSKIIKRKRKNKYNSIANATAQDIAISYEALGVLVYLLSKPVDWETKLHDLQKRGNGKSKVYRILKELEMAGYMTKPTKYQDKKGLWQWTPRYVYDEPCPQKPCTDEPCTDNGEIKEQRTDEKEQITKKELSPPKAGNDDGNPVNTSKCAVCGVWLFSYSDMPICGICEADIYKGYPQMENGWQRITGKPSLGMIVCFRCGGVICDNEQHSDYWIQASGRTLCAGCHGGDGEPITPDDRLTDEQAAALEDTPFMAMSIVGRRHTDILDDMMFDRLVAYNSPDTKMIVPTPAGHAALEAYKAAQDSTMQKNDNAVADLTAAPTMTQVAAEIYGTRDNPVKPTEHIGALCEVDTPPPEAKKARKRTANQLALDAMMEAIIAATPNIDSSKLKGGAWGPYQTTGKWLIARDATPDDMAAFVPFVIAESNKQGWTYSVRCLTGKDRWPRFCGQRQARQQAQANTDTPQPLSPTDGIVRGAGQ